MEKKNCKPTITLDKLNKIQLCHKPIIIYQYDSQATTQFKFRLWEQVEDHLDLLTRTIENLRIECLFCQSNNESFMRHLYLLIKHKIKIKM